MEIDINYGDLPGQYSAKDKSRIVVIPVPYDKTSTWIKGSDKGPAAITEASANMELYDIETDSEVYREGIYTDKPVKEDSPEEMVKSVKKRVEGYIKDGKFVVVMGGEHSVSIGAIFAHAEHYRHICVLQLDAHTDLREEYDGSKYNHACVMARAREKCPIIQVGIRSMDISETKSIDKNRLFLAEELHDKRDWAEEVVSRLSPNVYITIDLDVFDHSIMPSVGTPEPGGLLWHDVLSLLKKVIQKRNLVGFDVAELCPSKGNKSPDFLAAKLIYKILSYKFKCGRV